MSAPVLPRRGFLRGLATLPLIGGSVALIGKPTAAAVPVSDRLLRQYGAFCWCDLTKTTRLLQQVHGPSFTWSDFGREFIEPQLAFQGPEENAAVVLSAVGLTDWMRQP